MAKRTLAKKAGRALGTVVMAAVVAVLLVIVVARYVEYSATAADDARLLGR